MKQKYLLQLTVRGIEDKIDLIFVSSLWQANRAFQGLRVALNNSMFKRLDLYLENKHGRYKLNGVNFNGGLDHGL